MSIDLDNGSVTFSKGKIRSNNGESLFDVDRGYLYFYKKYPEMYGIPAHEDMLLLCESAIYFGTPEDSFAVINRVSDDLDINVRKHGGLRIGTGFDLYGDKTVCSSVNLQCKGSPGDAYFNLTTYKDPSKNSFVISSNSGAGERISIMGGPTITGKDPRLSLNGNVDIWDNLNVNKSVTIHNGLQVIGSKNSLVETTLGWTLLNAYETAEYYFGDIAKTNTGASKRVKIMIDPLFLETINTEIDYHVFVSSYNNGYAWVSEMAKDYFVIESNVPNLSVSYEIKAKRKQYENVRLDKVDVNLTGGTK